ncbi:hypothetical protein AWZ03_012705 [Drosophila navojoa]|uniref:Uncharacterized protein n=1 Tax=Drosophila navojoa TaxID=7232 RepID=A0A484AWV2_DRONA|nr:hypothetical protein AWZ03_012705 [Drosophila navojoa]
MLCYDLKASLTSTATPAATVAGIFWLFKGHNCRYCPLPTATATAAAAATATPAKLHTSTKHSHYSLPVPPVPPVPPIPPVPVVSPCFAAYVMWQQQPTPDPTPPPIASNN